jgi:hypothetical protein
MIRLQEKGSMIVNKIYELNNYYYKEVKEQ